MRAKRDAGGNRRANARDERAFLRFFALELGFDRDDHNKEMTIH